ncbi:hypothetical protein DICPUDRAFT_80083 [Dictyostelium purpureum]|uniref:F-box domain-containing protein n=1 Tax=Dictyostelium purpureum TaxID=5786 RepID=F0ZPH4_DICPU|nr:uncharacterized protein DICPUDRAFT_80083 [Dictyostelium purpureum]EGC34158.1 hypothetical protein DICPUDRAFT_80083 [Dictyostelium purpureum]|eukprot:XP_003289312.1 hypothetical protein DICPUDRAFT_80083 [Dictyostelium purpureum]
MNFEINSSNSNLETIFNYLKRDLLLNSNNTINININNYKNKKKKKRINTIEQYESFLFILPNEIFSKILSNLDYKDIISLSLINNHFYSLINSYNNLWRKLYFKKYKNYNKLNHFGFCKNPPNHCNNCNKNSNYNNNSYNENWKSKYLKNKKENKNWKNGKYSVTSLDTNIGGIFCLSQKSNMLVTGSFDRELKLWKLKAPSKSNRKLSIEPVMNIRGHDGWIWSTHLKTSKNFHKIKCISSSQDGTIMVSDIDKEEFDRMESSNGHGEDRTGLDNHSGSSSGNDSSGTNSTYFNNNHNNINFNNKTARSFNLKTSKQQMSTEFPRQPQQSHSKLIDGTFLKGHKGTVWTTQPDKQLKHLYSGGGDSLIKQWDIERTCFVSDIGKHNESILCLSGVSTEHPDLLASGSADHTIRLWDIRAPPKMVLCINEHGVNIDCLSLSNHFIVSGGDDGVLRVSDIRYMITSPRPYVIAEIPAHEGSIRALSIKRDKMVTTSSDMSIKIWQIKKMESTPSHCLLGHHGSVVSMQLKSNMIISGSLDSSVKIWDFSN